MEILALLAIASPPETWVVMPVVARNPPPRDPTMLRMSVDLAKAITGAVSGPVRLAKREERDSVCASGCPPEIASILEADHVVELVLDDGMDALLVRVFDRDRGTSKSKVPCTYGGGVVECDAGALAQSFARKDDAELDPKTVEDAFAKLGDRLRACGPPLPKIEATVRFRARPDGRVTDVRVSPTKVQTKKPYACMARVVESLRVPPFAGSKPVAFQLALPKLDVPSGKK
jgi:hypothetical protein